MSESIALSPELADYLVRHNPPEPDSLRRLRAETRARTDLPQMQISWEQAAFMQLMARLIGARRYLEIGTFTGYSALALAYALPRDGRILACDISEDWTAIARDYWQQAGVADRIELQLRPALETLDELIAGEADPFDLCFIDADKENYDSYYERALKLVRPGGLILVDNMLWGGKVVDPEADDGATRCIRALNEKVAGDSRVAMALTSIGDGLIVAMKR